MSRTRGFDASARREREHLLLAAGQQAGAPAQQPLELGEERDRVRDRAAAEPEVRAGREHRDHRALLGHEREPFARAPVERRAPRRDDPARPPHLTAERRELAGEGQQRRGLPRTVGADQGDDLARLDGEVEIADCGKVAVAGVQAVRGEQRRRRAVPGPDRDTRRPGHRLLDWRFCWRPDPRLDRLDRRGAGRRSRDRRGLRDRLDLDRFRAPHGGRARRRRRLAEVRGDDGGVGPDLLRCPRREVAARVEHADAVARAEHQLDVVLDDEHPHPPLAREPAHQAPELGGLAVVEAGSRFVEHQHRGPGGDGPRDGDQSPPPERQLVGPAVEIVLEAELAHRRARVRTETRPHRPHEIGHVRPAVAPVARGLQVLADRHGLEELQALERTAEARVCGTAPSGPTATGRSVASNPSRA